jgi:hypothetical protein
MALEGTDSSQSQPFQRGKVNTSDGLSQIEEGITPAVTVVFSIRQSSDAKAVEDNNQNSPENTLGVPRIFPNGSRCP